MWSENLNNLCSKGVKRSNMNVSGILEECVLEYRVVQKDRDSQIWLYSQYPLSPLGDADTDKQSSSAKLACACLSLGHLPAINGAKGGVIYSRKFLNHTPLQMTFFRNTEFGSFS